MKSRGLGAAAALTAAVAVAFGPALRAPFLWDDWGLVAGNERLVSLSAHNIAWMLTSTRMTAYMPLGWFFFAFVRATAGLSPGAFHAEALVIHALTAAVFFFCASRFFARAGLKDADFAAFSAALLFAVHPLQSFSAGWVTEIPDMLAALFFLLAVYVYLGNGPRAKHAAVLGLFGVSLLFRWKGICLPFVLSLLDYWPLKAGLRKNLPSKTPLWILAVLFAVLNSAAKRGLGIVPSWHPLYAARGLALFAWLHLWPHDVLPLYMLNEPDTLRIPGALALALAVAAGAWAWSARRRVPAAAVGGAFYLAALLPPLAHAQNGALIVFPHYAYLAGLPLFLALGEGARRLRARAGTAAAAAALVALAGAWTLESRTMSALRRDEAGFWIRAVALDGESRTSYTNAGEALTRAGRYNDAYFYLQAQLNHNPGDGFAARGMEFLHESAPALRPDPVAFWVASADDETALGRPRDALILCGKALRARPRDRAAHAAAARAFAALGDAARAADHRRAS